MEDYSAYPDEGVVEGRVLRQAVAKSRKKNAGGALSNNVTPTNPIAGYRQRESDLYQQGAELYDSEPDYSQFQEFAKQRGQEGQGAMLNALAAQFAGESFQPIQAQFLKKAAAAQDPMKLGSGLLTPDGKYLKDPEAAQNKKAEFLLSQAKAYGQMALSAETAQERAAALAAQNQVNNQLKGLMAQAAMITAQAARDRADNGSVGSFTQSGFTPEGKQIVTNKTGINYLLELGPNGVPSYTPYAGSVIPKGTFDKNVGAVQTALASAQRADDLLKMVDENPAAFGVTAQAVSALPGFMQGRVGAAVLDKGTLENRATILRQAAMEISDLYGAALSLGEQARANTFIPNKDDPPEALMAKLKAARDWAKNTANTYGVGVIDAAQKRTGAPTAPAASGLSAEEKAELERLRKQFGRQ